MDGLCGIVDSIKADVAVMIYVRSGEEMVSSVQMAVGEEILPIKFLHQVYPTS